MLGFISVRLETRLGQKPWFLTFYVPELYCMRVISSLTSLVSFPLLIALIHLLLRGAQEGWKQKNFGLRKGEDFQYLSFLELSLFKMSTHQIKLGQGSRGVIPVRLKPFALSISLLVNTIIDA